MNLPPISGWKITELQFTSPVDTPYPENNTVHARLFRAKQNPGKPKKAVVVLPHWNASLNQHMALCAGIAKLGITALRMSLPYHDHRMPPELERADYAVSSNVARTIDATRQAVIDMRAALIGCSSKAMSGSGLWAPASVPAMPFWPARMTRESP